MMDIILVITALIAIPLVIAIICLSFIYLYYQVVIYLCGLVLKAYNHIKKDET